MKIWASCKCCTKKNFLVNDYALGQSFNKKTEFGTQLFKSLKDHLLALQDALKSQGHYDRIFITPDAFVEEEAKIPQEILDLFLPEDKKKKMRPEKEQQPKEKVYTFEGWFQEYQAGRQGITQEQCDELIKTQGTIKEQEQFTWEAIEEMLKTTEEDREHE
ncbi:protein of unknown function [endosymbiont DhMRE of Dentiscutata heterogama]|uniref:hypothetical protein n=1 Tax=endosymbiont DhMRE of Dentiscutata heterogama TaxID=1609546 RepID=UPI000629D886|nr:hypothetical protein [endosymbiont DhMRE of Dentiscutata heterogama]CFW93401.1 protein of unknown function [endosymbiont DhMRE of Dentiscutata heterogama]